MRVQNKYLVQVTNFGTRHCGPTVDLTLVSTFQRDYIDYSLTIAVSA